MFSDPKYFNKTFTLYLFEYLFVSIHFVVGYTFLAQRIRILLFYPGVENLISSMFYLIQSVMSGLYIGSIETGALG